MAERMPERPTGDHPVVAGLVALVGVGLVVGLILGGLSIVGAKLTGLEGGSGGGPGSQPTMYVPPIRKTSEPTAPQTTLGTGQETASPTGKRGEERTREPRPRRISLSASATAVAPMESFHLSGVYPGGEGAILQVQRFTGGRWQDFPVTTSVSNETFSVSMQTSQTGVNRFRVVDTDTGLTSNEVRVTIR